MVLPETVVFKSTLTLLEVPPFAVMMSSMPSRFTSPKVTELGASPVAKSVLLSKAPGTLPLPNSTLAVSEPSFAVMMSSMPSRFKSPKVTELGPFPVP